MELYNPEDYGYCPYCMSYPHKSGCPNEQRTHKKVGLCKICEEEIYSGDIIIDVDGSRYHDECFLERYRHEA